MSMKIKYWNVTLIVCILPVYLYHVWSFKLPHTLRDYHSTLNHAVQRVFIQYKCCLVDVSQWMIHNKTLLTYHRRWKQNDNSRLQVHLCCRLRESSPSIKICNALPISLFVSNVSFIWYSGSRRTIGRCEGFLHSGRESTGFQRPKTSGLRKQKLIIDMPS